MTIEQPPGPAVAPEAADPVREPASLVTNSGVMFVSRLYLLLTTGALSIYAIRSFSTETYGRYAVAAALIAIFGLLSEMGITTIALREMAMHPDRRPRVLGVAIWSELATWVLAIVVMFPTALALGYGGRILAYLAIGAGIIFFQGLISALEASFQASRLLVYPAIFVLVQGTVTAAVGFSLVAAGVGPAGLLTGILAGWASGTVGAALLLFRRLRIRPTMAGTWRRVPGFVRLALPVAATGGMAAIYDRVDVVMLSQLANERAVALYSVPLTILQYSMIVPAIVATAFFPLLAELLRTAPTAARDSFGLLLRIFTFVSVPIALLLSVLAEPLLTLLFGARYGAASGPLAILAWSVVLGFLNYLFWYCLLAAYREGAKFRIMLVGLGLNLALNFGLIPRFGPRGAAVSLLASDLLVVVWQGVLVHRHLFPIGLRAFLAKPVVAAAVSGAVLAATIGLSRWLAAFAAAGAYAGLLLALRYVSWEEWQPLVVPARSLLRHARAQFQ